MDDSGIDFIKKCIQVIERRGLDEQGLYRVVGMQSKVNSVVAGHFGNLFENKKKKTKILSLFQMYIKQLHND